jgi:hypothetical protein
MRLRLVLFCLYSVLFSIVVTPLAAQTDIKFSADKPDEFINQLGVFMTTSKRPDLEEAFSVFRKTYRDGLLSGDKLVAVIRVSNLMMGHKLTPLPYFKDYTNAVSAAVSATDTTLFRRWHPTVEKALADLEQGRGRLIGGMLEFSAAFLTEKALKIGTTGSASWKIRGGQYDFDYRDKKPVVSIQNADLMALRKEDSVVIRRTSGLFWPMEGLWRGNGGKVTWQSVGFDSTIFAALTRYKVETNKPSMKCDTATLYYPLYFKSPVAGRFEDNVIAQGDSMTVQYPRFESFDKRILLTNKIGQGIDYTGGFKLMGSSVYGYGTDTLPALISVYNKKRQRVLYTAGQLFVIRREQLVVGEGAYTKLFIDGDSIFHPSVGVRLNIKDQTVQLLRGRKGSERNPFYSSYYSMNLDAESLLFNITNDSLEIGTRATMMKGSSQKVQFESNNRFDLKEYEKYQNIGAKNPIATLYIVSEQIAKQGESKFVSDNVFAQAMNPAWDYSNIQTVLAQLVADGFVNYDFKRHMIEIRPKLDHYAKAAQGKVDFDAINIISESTTANAKLDMKTKQTSIFEVKKIELSQRQQVAVSPDNKQITLLKNRDMRFNGRLWAGFALFEGRRMFFEYDKFAVSFDSVRHLDYYLPTGKKTKEGMPEALSMNSTVEYVTGTLLVDAPNNKSGKEDLSIFPSLQSKKNSYVFYDKPAILGGVYKRDSFYFRLDPFSFNRLDAYTPEDLKFKGEMYSTTIFPPYKETIIVRDHDKSFGFIHKTPETGYPTYSKKGQYTGILDLSNKGYLGKGKVRYLTAEIQSEDIVFRPRQMTATARTFFMEEDREGTVKIPQAKGENVKVNWLPYKDSMYVESKAKDFELFKEPGYTHKGTLILTPTGLKGKGIFEWAGGRLSSKLIAYGPFQASADTADLQIKALEGTGIVFDSKNVKGTLDFDAQDGHFKANSTKANTTLPLNQYRTSMNEFDWDMKEQTITFKSDPNKPGVFVSIDPEQDTLRFTGKTAFYDMKSSQLKIGGVDFIKSADAFIYPDSGAVEILPKGKMKEMDNCRIVADTITKYHTINRAKVNIGGKKYFTASGYYAYDLPGRKQEIFFENIVGQRRGGGNSVTKNVFTSASGSVTEEANFYIDEKLKFKGDILLSSNQSNLRMEGYAKLDADRLPDASWFLLYSTVDRKDPVITVTKTRSEEEEPLRVGFFLSKETGDAYPRVLQPCATRTDRPLLDAQHVFKYDGKTNRFIFGDSSKIVANAAKGAKLVFDNKSGIVQAEGPITIGSGLNYVKIAGAGKLKCDLNSATDTTGYITTGELMTGIEMTIPKALLEIMLNETMASSFDAPNAIYTSQSEFYKMALPEFVADPKNNGEVLAGLQTNVVALPKTDSKYTFLLGRHPVKWNSEYQSFISMEDKFPLIAVGGIPFGKVLNTFVEYKMTSGEDDRLYLYFKVSPDVWYYFGYQGGVLETVSSSTRYNDALASMKPKDLQIKMPDGEMYEITLAAPSRADAFVSRVKSGR